jgi:hypothetical protein
MDQLSDLFESQQAFNRAVLVNHGVDLETMTREQVIDWTLWTVIALHKELGELIDNFDWKRHRAPRGTWNPEEAVNELVDLQKYTWNLFGFWGITTPAAFAAAFTRKSAVVDKRWEEEQARVGHKS